MADMINGLTHVKETPLVEPYDPWHLPDALVKRDISFRLFSKAIEGVVPLDDQLLSVDRVHVPDTLREPIFGMPDPMHDAPADTVVPYSYAVMDAAKVQNLPEVLAGTGLKHLCLFSGDAVESFGDLTPWIVELDATATFT